MAIKEFVHFGLCRVLIMLHFHCSVEWRAESNLFRLIALPEPGCYSEGGIFVEQLFYLLHNMSPDQ